MLNFMQKESGRLTAPFTVHDMEDFKQIGKLCIPAVWEPGESVVVAV